MIKTKKGFPKNFGLSLLFLFSLFFTVQVDFAEAIIPQPDMTIGDLIYVGRTQVGRTIFEYTYKVNLTNNGTAKYTNVRATVTSSSSATVIKEGDVTFGEVAAGATVTSTDTFTFQHNHRYTFNAAALNWTISGDEQAVQDSDGDGVADGVDQCPGHDDRLDVDHDGTPDGCDDLIDSDNDGVADGVDQCPGHDDRIDVDHDGTPDGCDDLIDSDNDGVANDVDKCPGYDDRIDADQDGTPEGCDQCAGHDDSIDIDNNGTPDGCESFTLTGAVFGDGRPLAYAEIKVGPNSVSTEANGAGGFTISLGTSDLVSDGISYFFPVNVTAAGYAKGHAKVVKNASDVTYTVEINLIPISDEIEDTDDVTTGVEISHEGEKVGELTIPATSLPAGSTGVKGRVTYIDPTTTDIGAVPGGDFLAIREGQDPNTDTPVTLESLGMMEFDLVDQAGNQISELNGPAEVCMKVPASMTVATGETVPLWYYDPETGLWVEEGSGLVEDREADGKWMCGNVTHFTWWNYDWPVTTHSCFKFQFVNEMTGAPIDDLSWYADGVTYSGTSPERDCNCDGNDPAPCSNNPIGSFTVKISDSVDDPEQIQVYTTNNGVRYYLVRDGDGTYSLSTNVANATTFDNPTESGSCLLNSNVNRCHFLDEGDNVTGSGLAADGNNGLLPLATFNRAPTISSLTAESTSILLGGSSNLTGVVTDPENDPFSVSWSATCWPNFDEGLVVTGDDSAIFNAPSAIGGYPAVSCEVTLAATDDKGNTSSASQQFIVRDANVFHTVEGTIYGTDGNPLANYPVRFAGNDSNYERTVTTDQTGHYSFTDIPYCEFSRGELYVDFTYDDPADTDDVPVQWQSQTEVYLNCQGGEAYASRAVVAATSAAVIGETECAYDIYLPTLWGTVQGTYYDASGAPVAGEEIYLYNYDQYRYQSVSFFTAQPVTFTGEGQYGPISVPLGDNYFSGWNLYTNISILYRGQNGVKDLGPGVTGTVSGTLFNDDGTPAAGVQVQLSGYDSNTTFTDTAGQYSFANVPGGTVFVYVPSLGKYAYGEVNRRGETAVVNINQSGCSVTGTVYDQTGQPQVVSDDGLSLSTLPGGVVFGTSTDSAGNFTFTDFTSGYGGLSAGVYSAGEWSSVGYRDFLIPSAAPIRVDIQVFPVQEGCFYGE